MQKYYLRTLFAFFIMITACVIEPVWAQDESGDLAQKL